MALRLNIRSLRISLLYRVALDTPASSATVLKLIVLVLERFNLSIALLTFSIVSWFFFSANSFKPSVFLLLFFLTFILHNFVKLFYLIIKYNSTLHSIILCLFLFTKINKYVFLHKKTHVIIT